MVGKWRWPVVGNATTEIRMGPLRQARVGLNALPDGEIMSSLWWSSAKNFLFARHPSICSRDDKRKSIFFPDSPRIFHANDAKRESDLASWDNRTDLSAANCLAKRAALIND
jgi:hypothetical protein